MTTLDDLTVAITNYRRPGYLDRALRSCRDAGIRRITISAVEPDGQVDLTIARHEKGWLSYDVARVHSDIGCNNSWMLAVYRARTKHVIVLHDDDTLRADFGQAFTSIIAPALDSGVGFASWRASLLFDNGKTDQAEYFHGPTREVPSAELKEVVGQRGRLSLSPIVSVFDRATLLDALKDADQNLTHNDCLYHPGMLLGTEIVAYLRHIQKFPRWFYVDKILAHYGAHPGSGTKAAEKNNTTDELARGYDHARDLCELPMDGAGQRKPRVIVAYIAGPQDAPVRASWDHAFNTGEVIELPVFPQDVARPGKTLFLKDVLDYAAKLARPEDRIVYASRNVGFTQIGALVMRSMDTARCITRERKRVDARVPFTVSNCKTDGGVGAFVIKASFWGTSSHIVPDVTVDRTEFDRAMEEISNEVCELDDVCWRVRK